MEKCVIIGAGITGCTVGLALAQQGKSVEIVEAGSRVGGKVLDYCCKATDSCSRCGVCIAHTTINSVLHHENISITTGATITKAENTGKQVTVQVSSRSPQIKHQLCIDCNACLTACPAKCITRYGRAELVQYSIDYPQCLLQQGKECNQCAAACPTRAIEAGAATKETAITADTALVSVGHTVFDALQKPRFGHQRFEQVLTGEEAEAVLAQQPYLFQAKESVAFIQCVGSRDPQLGRNYCSSVCCAYACRLARVLKHRNPENDITIYFIDLQNFDKAFTPFRDELEAQGVKFVRGVPFNIEKNGQGKLLLRNEDPQGGERVAEHDAVILSVGLGAAEASAGLAGKFGLQQDEFGFLSSKQANVFVAGTCQAPQSIPESMAGARAIATRMETL